MGLRSLSDEFLTVPTDKGANPGLKVSSLVAGMVAGADSIDDMAVLRHGGIGTVSDDAYAPSDAGIVAAGVHLRACPAARRGRFPGARRPELGDAAAARHRSRRLGRCGRHDIEVHGRQEGAGFGYSGIFGIKAR